MTFRGTAQALGIAPLGPVIALALLWAGAASRAARPGGRAGAAGGGAGDPLLEPAVAGGAHRGRGRVRRPGRRRVRLPAAARAHRAPPPRFAPRRAALREGSSP